MPRLSTLECILLTFAVLGSVELLVALLENLDRPNSDCTELMKKYAKHKFFQDGQINRDNFSDRPYYH